MNRRHFLTAILASSCAPAIVRAESIMRVITHTAWLNYASGDLLIPYRGCNSSYFENAEGADALITREEAQHWLQRAAIRLIPEPAWDWVNHDPNKYTSPEIFHDGRWKSLCRTDLCDDVATGWVHNQSAEAWRKHYLNKINIGLRITDDRFSVIDCTTDG